MKLILAALFFITAALYASVGFGGGSTYTALLAVSGTDYILIPILSLACNIVVVSGNTLRYGREKLIDYPRIWPLIILSIPAAWLGGRLQISETLFLGLLCAALFLAGVRLIFVSKNAILAPFMVNKILSKGVLARNALIGGIIGFISGLVGIGGGIFLAPVLHFLKWGSAKAIAAACSLFILVNSVSGLLGQATKLGDVSRLSDAVEYWPLIPAVLLGGFIGNYMGVFKISDMWLKRLTGLLIIIVAIRLSFRWASLMF